MEKFAWSEWQIGLSLGYAGVFMIIGPLLMTKLFSTYTGVDASYYLPGAPFFAAALLTLASLILFVPLVRHFGLTTLGRRAVPAPS